jgi:hypothetical protein
MGTGYLSVWELVHRAQEALIDVEPLSNVVLRARYDQLRLTGARIPNCEQLRKSLDTVINYSPALLVIPWPTAQRSSAEEEARMIVWTVRQTLNEYRDESRAGLVRLRIQLACTTLTTGLIGYGILCLALVGGVSATMLLAAVAYFLTGALVGLVSRLRTEFESDTAIDDFGLSTMRQFAGPQLSGVAAVVGVAVLGLSGVTGSHSDAALPQAFDLATSPVNLIAAAVFGLTPSLLIQRLQQHADTFKDNLRSTEPQASLPKTAP